MEPGDFQGTIARYATDGAVAHWPEPARPPDGAPNVVVVVLDDVGFAQLGCYGSDIATPHLDALAAGGLRFSRFHTTALCSPTRSCLLTGRNHHANGMGRITELAMGFPGYDARIPRANGFVSELLLQHGWATWAVGKWHLTPEEDAHEAGSRRTWPLGRGFERWYGFHGGETSQFEPALWSDNHSVDPPASPAEGYHLTEDLVDRSIRLVDDLRAVDVDKPFFLWFATGACHSPHQSPQRWRDRYWGAFDDGWDAWRQRAVERQRALGVIPADCTPAPRPDWVPAWDDLSPRARAVYARYMEAFAAFLSHTDEQIGRLVAHLDERGELERTLVVVCSDNGASSEGGPTGSLNDNRPWNLLGRTVGEALDAIDEIGGPRRHTNYPWGWTVAGNTPFRRWKREVHNGGIADPMIVHWPGHVPDPGGVRHQFTHAIDVAPTILAACGIEPPDVLDGVPQRHLDGVSFLAAVEDPAAPEHRTTQYFEMFGCCALYHDGYKAVTFHELQDAAHPLAEDRWELYDLRTDPTELVDLAADEPERLAAMVERFWVEAEANGVLPLDQRAFSDLVAERPRGVAPRQRYEYRPHTAPVPEDVAVNVRNRRHVVTATVEVGATDGAAAPQGALLVQGSVLGGWSFHVADGELVYE
ncbi:MAG: arylsulfatase, partial [Acidimicrobiales bacterium]|nr:arylsulfatase [Acidimicrobiales bacterium]